MNCILKKFQRECAVVVLYYKPIVIKLTINNKSIKRVSVVKGSTLQGQRPPLCDDGKARLEDSMWKKFNRFSSVYTNLVLLTYNRPPSIVPRRSVIRV